MKEELERQIFKDDVGGAEEFDTDIDLRDYNALPDIDRLIDMLKKAKESGANRIEFSVSGYEYYYVKIQPVKVSQESYGEWMERVRKAKEILEIKKKMKIEAAKKAEHTNYLRLKKIFENK